MKESELLELLESLWKEEIDADEAMLKIRAASKRCVRGDGELIFQLDLIADL